MFWDEALALRADIGINKTNELAQAANKLPLDIRGQSSTPVTLTCETMEGTATIYLGIVLIVRGLGTACLIGEPGKAKNNIICLPRKKMILLAGENEIYHVPYLESKQPYLLARALTSTTLLPNECIELKLPPNMSNISHVSIVPRKQTLHWLTPAVLEAVDGKIQLLNSSQEVVNLKKWDHLADIRSTSVFYLPKIQPKPVHHDNF